MFPSFTIHEAGTSLNWDSELINANKLFFVGYPAILTLEVTKGQTLLPSLHWSYFVQRFVYPIMILIIVSGSIFFPLGKMSGAVRNKLHSVKPILGDWQSYSQCRKDEVVLCHARISHTHLTHSYILRKDLPPQCEHCQCILVECSRFAEKRKDIFGKRTQVEFHPTLILL